ncbi:uncharacterized protein LOC129590205 isoform X2 [Paramacrobiotus metropolitanus]|uniref:uncharacterized protein LOC129590205 isoform X2 n=1 Tax=Paramacrobiotus metropolitanus TaxID=2943436 RepID=UPI0024459292|nr:uncharacterized protein LOC129590205 isoform X2 [Paramacrobiotus metropolitanus]
MKTFYEAILCVLPALIIISNADLFPHSRLRRSVEIERQVAVDHQPFHQFAKREEDEIPERQSVSSGMQNGAVVPENDAPLAFSDGQHFHPAPMEAFLVNNKVKMGNNTGAYTKKQAMDICNLYFAQLATQRQLTTAWLAGAEWCWYGHVVEALLALPINSPDMMSKCPGHDGKKGPRVVEYVTEGLSGATCYGVKPPRNFTKTYGDEMLTVLPFNPKRWSQFSGELRNTEDAAEDEEQGESIYDGVHEAHLSEHHEERDRINICVRKYIAVDYEEIMKKYPKLTREDIKDYQIEFKLLDLNQDGLLDFDELSQLLDNIGDNSNREKRQLLFQEIDVDNSGLLDFDEFLTLMDILAGKPKTDQPEEGSLGARQNMMAEYFMRAGEINRRIRRMNLFDQITNKLF